MLTCFQTPMMVRTLKFSLISVGLIVGLALILPSPSYAVPVSPDKYFLDVVYGEPIQDQLLIMARPELEPGTTLYIQAVGMQKYGEEHDRRFYIPDPDDQFEPANWITLEQTEIVADPETEYYVDWEMTPSAYMSCGTNLAALMISDTPIVAGDEGIVTIQREIISQIHFNVVETSSGLCLENRTDLQLLEFFVDKPVPVFNYDQVPFVTRIENNGNIISRNPTGYIEIFGLGDKITLDFNPEQLDIYPETVRKFSNTWIDPEYPSDGTFIDKLLFEWTHLRIGRYEARLGVTKNVDSQIVSSVYFWIIPWRVILSVVVVLGVYYVFRRVRGGKEE